MKYVMAGNREIVRENSDCQFIHGAIRAALKLGAALGADRTSVIVNLC